VEIDKSPISATSSPPRRSRDKSEELLCDQDAEHRPHCPRDHRHQDQTGQGTNLRSCCTSGTLTNAPADPEIIATRTARAKSKRTTVTVSETAHVESNKIDVRTKNTPREPRLSSPMLMLSASSASSTTAKTRKTIALTIYNTTIDSPSEEMDKSEEYAAVTFAVHNEELVIADTLATNNKEYVDAATVVAYNEGFHINDSPSEEMEKFEEYADATFAAHIEELVTAEGYVAAAACATNDEEIHTDMNIVEGHTNVKSNKINEEDVFKQRERTG
jgi:hypothetical protein